MNLFQHFQAIQRLRQGDGLLFTAQRREQRTSRDQLLDGCAFRLEVALRLHRFTVPVGKCRGGAQAGNRLQQPFPGRSRQFQPFRGDDIEQAFVAGVEPGYFATALSRHAGCIARLRGIHPVGVDVNPDCVLACFVHG